MKPVIMAALLALAVPASAAAPVAAPASTAALFAAGNFAGAVSAGTAEATPASLILAGRSRLQMAASTVTDRTAAKTAINAAIADFNAALAKDPANIDAALQKVIAQGYIAQIDSSVSEAKGVKAGLDAILARAPNNAIAWAVLGGWNGGAVANAGSFIARTVLGATTDGMNSAFAKAMSLDPTNPAHPIIYAMTLLNVSANNAPQAKALLTRAATLPAHDALDAIYKAGGAKVLAAIGDPKAAQALSRRLMPFGTVK